jgi:minor extracellular serine protease Vpr
MSLGGGSSYKSNPQAVLGDKLVARGMVLAAAAGNDGSEGVWMVSDTGLGDLSTSVASFDNIYGFYNSFTYDGAVHPYAPSEAWGKDLTSLEKDTLLPIFEKDGSLSDGCDATRYAGLALKGKVVLVLGDISRCRSKGRGDIGLAAGAAGMLVQTTPLGMAGLAGNDKLPMGSIEFKAGEALLASYKKNPKNALTFSKKPSNFLVEGGGAPSDFSSFGLDGELRSKPDIAAPGGNILSTYPLAKGGYTLMSGTSMATPYIAGAHALYMQSKHGKPHGDEIRKVFKNTATISKNAGSKTFTSAAKQGAGLINVLNAVTATSSISPDHIDLLDTNHLQKTVKITLKNSGKKTETYKFSHIPADALNSYPKGNSWPAATPIIEADSASVVFSQNTVKIPAGKSAKITLHFTEPKAGKASQFPIYSGYVVATPSSKGGVAVHVPYTGLKGDVSKVPIMDVDNHFPMFVSVNAAGNVTEVPKDLTFDMKNNTPVFATRFGSHTPSAEIRVFDAAKKSFVGFMSTQGGNAVGWSGRMKNLDDQGNMIMNNYVWTGEVITTANSTSPVTLPAGTYDVVIASQRKLTKGEYPKDYETFEFKGIKI